MGNLFSYRHGTSDPGAKFRVIVSGFACFWGVYLFALIRGRNTYEASVVVCFASGVAVLFCFVLVTVEGFLKKLILLGEKERGLFRSDHPHQGFKAPAMGSSRGV